MIDDISQVLPSTHQNAPLIENFDFRQPVSICRESTGENILFCFQFNLFLHQNVDRGRAEASQGGIK